MSPASANLSVAILDDTVCVRIEGRANFASSMDFKRLIFEMIESGHHRFVADLTQCLNMDSTFLGVMAKIGLELEKLREETPKAALRLLNPSERIEDLLDNLGILHLFELVNGDEFEEECLEEVPVGDPAPSKKEISKNCLEAHEILMSIHPDNIPKFKDVTKFFAEDIKKMAD